MRFAYADPPYLSGAHLYKVHHPEWHVYGTIEGHRELVDRLQREYPDGWVVSLGAVDVDAYSTILPVGKRWGRLVQIVRVVQARREPGLHVRDDRVDGGASTGKGCADRA